MTNKKTLILYSSIDGHTQHICETIADKLTAQLTDKNDKIELQSLDDFMTKAQNEALSGIDTIILGASIRYGKHRANVHEFARQYQQICQQHQIKTAFFSVNLVARKADKNTPETNSYVVKFLETTNWQPDVVDVFAGKLDYSIYGLVDKWMIKLIMKITKGETSSDKPIIYTDWQRVTEFVRTVEQLHK